MRFMLDTNICIYIIKQRPQSVLRRFSTISVGDIGISIITFAELEYGAAKSAQPKRNRDALEEFLSPLEVLDFDKQAAEAADPEVLAFEIFHAFYIRAGHEVVVRTVHGGHHDSHRQAGDRRADEIGECTAIVDVAGDDPIHDDLVLHDHDDGIDALAFEKTLLFGDNEG